MVWGVQPMNAKETAETLVKVLENAIANGALEDIDNTAPPPSINNHNNYTHAIRSLIRGLEDKLTVIS